MLVILLAPIYKPLLQSQNTGNVVNMTLPVIGVDSITGVGRNHGVSGHRENWVGLPSVLIQTIFSSTFLQG